MKTVTHVSSKVITHSECVKIIYFFFTATTVVLSYLIITLYVDCLYFVVLCVSEVANSIKGPMKFHRGTTSCVCLIVY